MTPLDCGQEKPDPGQEPNPEARMLRPIARAEALVKFTETTTIDEESKHVLIKMEPRNLGLGTPDAAALIVR